MHLSVYVGAFVTKLARFTLKLYSHTHKTLKRNFIICIFKHLLTVEQTICYQRASSLGTIFLLTISWHLHFVINVLRPVGVCVCVCTQNYHTFVYSHSIWHIVCMWRTPICQPERFVKAFQHFCSSLYLYLYLLRMCGKSTFRLSALFATIYFHIWICKHKCLEIWMSWNMYCWICVHVCICLARLWQL